MRIRSAKNWLWILCGLAALGLAWAQKDEGPQPRVVDPGKPGQAPADAIVLFNGQDGSQWTRSDGTPIRWPIRDGELLCKSGAGNIYSKQKFLSAQIHLEFFLPYMPDQHGQARANSGVFLQNHYEVQILDSYQNPTYADGSCAALYGQYAPLVNASRPPRQWQTYDIIFHSTKCSSDGKLLQPGNLTVLHNGVLVQDHVAIRKYIAWRPGGGDNDGDIVDLEKGGCAAGIGEPGPLVLQDHSGPNGPNTEVKFRNIWVRPLAD
jgi:hypothetical protein